MPTLTEVTFTQEDLEDLGGVQPFALEASKLDQYDFKYSGKERIDELDTYIFDVAPKIVPKKVSERFFQGRVWVDQQDLQIVKVRGKGVPEGNQRFPIFETYRQQIDGRIGFRLIRMQMTNCYSPKELLSTYECLFVITITSAFAVKFGL